jgi:hypothetical protein
MKASDREPFIDLISSVMAYYGKSASPFVLSVWWTACERYSLEQVEKALTRHASDPDAGRFAPKVADLIRVLEGTTTDKSAIAWGKALDAAQRVGAYSDVVFDDPAIHAAIEDLGGWVKFCRTETKDLGYTQHRFTESYRAYAAREAFDYPRKLCGDRSPDDVFLMRGLPPPDPVLVGDPVKGRAVYQFGGEGSKTPIRVADAAFEQLPAPRLEHRHAA